MTQPAARSTNVLDAPDASVSRDLERLNRLSLTHSFTPQTDLDWSRRTTEEEYAAWYDVAALLVGTGTDRDFDAATRAEYARYQQVNLMLFTALLERHGIASLTKVYDLDSSLPFAEYVGHFVKEESYHYTMFTRAIAALEEEVPDRPPLPRTAADRALRFVFGLIDWLPGRRLRTRLAFTFFEFAERLTIHVNEFARGAIPRDESLIRQVWSRHALDESRHLAFDALILERCRMPRGLRWLPIALAAPCCALLSLVVNWNEVWIARRCGARVRWWHVLRLMRHTTAPFKRRVFTLLNTVVLSRPEPTEDDS